MISTGITSGVLTGISLTVVLGFSCSAVRVAAASVLSGVDFPCLGDGCCWTGFNHQVGICEDCDSSSSGGMVSAGVVGSTGGGESRLITYKPKFY